jgi:hypothetical protein
LALAAVPSFFIFTCRSFSSLFERNKFSWVIIISRQ